MMSKSQEETEVSERLEEKALEAEMRRLGYPSHGCIPCRACLRFTRQVHFSSAVLNFQFARETTEQGNLSPCGQLLQTCLHS
jgi:hypothetical protein